MTEQNWPESIVAFLIPPACREEVLGDLYERNATAVGYVLDAIRTLPFVIASRIRRTSDPALLAMYAIASYLCFYAVAWHQVRPLLYERWGLWRLAIPCAVGLVALVLEDAYANPGRASKWWWLRGPVLAVTAAFVSQAALWAGGSQLVLPFVIVFRGGMAGFVLTFTIRLFFQPPTRSRRGPI